MPATESEQRERNRIRRDMRRLRRSISPQAQRQAAYQLGQRLLRQPLFIRSKHIAFYIANDGEIDPWGLLQVALRRGKKCYLPALEKGGENRLVFVRYTANSVFTSNRFGIAEPVMTRRNTLPAYALDLVLLPLVAFDRFGGRLGMGGGFYDRSFAFKSRTPSSKPYLMGLAHHGQEVEKLAVRHWDIPLHSVATDHGLILCSKSAWRRDFHNVDGWGGPESNRQRQVKGM